MRTVMCLAVLLAAAPAAAQPRDNVAPPDVIVTSGEAVLKRAPDRAFITLTVETRSKNPRDAQRLNADAMTAVQQRLMQARVTKESLRTLGYDLEQEFDFLSGRRVPREYVARNAVEVRVDEIARVGELLDVAVQGGATSIGGVRFDLQQREQVEREALRLAVADARARAEAVAGGANRSIDRVIRVEDAREGGVVPMARPMAMSMAKSDAAQTPVEPGLIEIRARVTLTAAMK
jgi:uncharacterized protein YggE